MAPTASPTLQEASARQRNIWTSARKLRRVVNEVRGKKVVDAYKMLRLMPYRAAEVVLKKLIDAIHNAKVKYGVRPEELVVSSIFADGGSKFIRFKPRAQGRIYKRRRRTSHLTVKVAVASSIAKG
jgi:large subunit ribosomal protein L22